MLFGGGPSALFARSEQRSTPVGAAGSGCGTTRASSSAVGQSTAASLARAAVGLGSDGTVASVWFAVVLGAAVGMVDVVVLAGGDALQPAISKLAVRSEQVHRGISR
jgi:hypothetical protein